MVGSETLATRPNILNVSLCLGEHEELFASNIDPRPSLSTDLPRTQQSTHALFTHGLPQTSNKLLSRKLHTLDRIISRTVGQAP